MKNQLLGLTKLTALTVLTVVGLLAAGCASDGPAEEELLPSAESYYQQALQKLEGERVLFFFTDVDYPGAIELFQEVIDNYPYSEYATLAELKIADVQFDRENYEEAASFYQDFVELHPTHPQISYAIYRHGLCSFNQIGAPNQDQTSTEDALAQFRVLLERYPDSPYAKDARARLRDTEDHLAQSDVNVGDFYFKRGDYFAAIRRYRRALTEYPSHTSRWHTMSQLATALKRLQRYYEAEQLFNQVLEAGPEDDDLIDHVRAELDEIESGEIGTDGTPPLLRSCVNDPNPACGNGAADR